MSTISRAELAALIDLGLADATIAKYLQMDTASVTELRSRYGLGQDGGTAPSGAAPSEPPPERTPAAAIAEMRDQARLFVAASNAAADPDQRLRSAVRAFELAQLAECEERRFLDMAETLARGAGVPAEANRADRAAALLEKAKRWRMRAAEYWAVSEAMNAPVARETYAHLARSYEKLAEQFEARADLSFGKKPADEEQTG